MNELKSVSAFSKGPAGYQAPRGGNSTSQVNLLTLCGEIKAMNERAIHAVEQGDVVALKDLMNTPDFNPSVAFKESKSLLHLAVEGGNSEILRQLLSHPRMRENINRALETPAIPAPYEGATPLLYAAKFGNLEAAELLLDAGADIDTGLRHELTSGATPAYFAAQSGNADMCRLLKARGADLNAARSHNGWTPLHVAAANNFLHVVTALGEGGGQAIEVNSLTNVGLSALGLMMLQANTENQSEYADTLAALIAIGVNPDVPNCDGRTPIAMAASEGTAELITMLRDAGANPNICDAGGVSAVAMAAKHGNIPVLKALYGKKEDPIKLDLNTTSAALHGNRPLHLAIRNGQDAFAAELLAHGAGLEYQDRVGATPLFTAVLTGAEQMVELLRDRGANPHAMLEDGTSLLHEAAMCGKASVIPLLPKSARKDLAAVTDQGKTPAMLAEELTDETTKNAVLAALEALAA